MLRIPLDFDLCINDTNLMIESLKSLIYFSASQKLLSANIVQEYVILIAITSVLQP